LKKLFSALRNRQSALSDPRRINSEGRNASSPGGASSLRRRRRGTDDDKDEGTEKNGADEDDDREPTCYRRTR